MTKAEYAEYLQSPHWQLTRAAALERACHRCQLCNSSKRLQVHHRTYVRLGNEDPTDLTVLCRGCHEKHHGIEKEPRKPKASARKMAKKAQREAARQAILDTIRNAPAPLRPTQVAVMAGIGAGQAAGLIGDMVHLGQLVRAGKCVVIATSPVAAAAAQAGKRKKPDVLTSTTQRRRAAVRVVGCPACGAARNERCHDKQGRTSEGNHPARVEAAHRFRNGAGVLV